MENPVRILPWTDRYWFQTYSYARFPVPPLFERGNAAEPHEPWRTGKAFIVRLPRTRKALAFGRWIEGPRIVRDEYDVPTMMFPEVGMTA